MICDCSDKKNYLIPYRMLKFCGRRGMERVKVHTVISIKQSNWLENFISFYTQKQDKARNDFEKVLYKLLKNEFYGKTMENVKSRLRIECFKKDDTNKIIKQQSKKTSNGLQKFL